MIGYATFDEFLNERDKGPKGGMTTASSVPAGPADYPSLQNYLGPIYSKAALAGSNDGQYESDEFDAAAQPRLPAPPR